MRQVSSDVAAHYAHLVNREQSNIDVATYQSGVVSLQNNNILSVGMKRQFYYISRES